MGKAIIAESATGVPLPYFTILNSGWCSRARSAPALTTCATMSGSWPGSWLSACTGRGKILQGVKFSTSCCSHRPRAVAPPADNARDRHLAQASRRLLVIC